VDARTHKKKQEKVQMYEMKEKAMSFPTFDIEPEKKKKLNFFKIGKIWCFKYFFDDKEIFNDLLEYYNREKYQFELGSVGTRNKIMNDLVSVEDAIANGAEKVV